MSDTTKPEVFQRVRKKLSGYRLELNQRHQFKEEVVRELDGKIRRETFMNGIVGTALLKNIIDVVDIRGSLTHQLGSKLNQPPQLGGLTLE